MTYSPTVYVNNSAPAISAENLNKSEQGIYNAYKLADKSQSELIDNNFNKEILTVQATLNASNNYIAYLPISTFEIGKLYILYSEAIADGTYSLKYFNGNYEQGNKSESVTFSEHYATIRVFNYYPSTESYLRLVFGTSPIYATASCTILRTTKGVFEELDNIKSNINDIDDNLYVREYSDITFNNESGKYLSTNGETTSGNRYYVSDYINVVPSEVYRIQKSKVGTAALDYAFYNGTTLVEPGTNGTGTNTSLSMDFEVTVPAGANKMRVGWYSNAALCKISKVAFVNFKDYLDGLGINGFDPMHGKTLIGLGDSLMSTQFCQSGEEWLSLIGARHNMTVYNHAIQGNPISYTDNCMAVRYSSMEDADNAYIVVIGGANDNNNQTPIGENTDDSIYTFKGALNVLINGLIAKYPTGKILFLTNYRRYGTASEKTYVDAMIEICALHSIPCFNNYISSDVHFDSRDFMNIYGANASDFSNKHLNKYGDARVSTMFEALLKAL